MTPAAFEGHMARLMGLKFPPSTLVTHYEALKDMPEPLLAAAIGIGQREWNEFPSPAEVRTAAERARTEGRVELQTPGGCDACSGTRWVTTQDEQGRLFAARCECWRRHHAVLAESSAAPSSGSKRQVRVN